MATALIWLLGVVGAAVVTVLINDPLKFALARLVGGYDPREDSLRGIWKATYDYPTEGVRKREHHYFEVRQVLPYVVARTISPGPAYYKLRGRLDRDRFLTGTWEERTPDYRFYHGAFQLAVRPQGRHMHGRWVGFNRHDVVMSGSWVWEQETREVTAEIRAEYAAPAGWSTHAMADGGPLGEGSVGLLDEASNQAEGPSTGALP